MSLPEWNDRLTSELPGWGDFVDGALAIANLLTNEQVGGAVPRGDGGASATAGGGPMVDEVAAMDTDTADGS